MEERPKLMTPEEVAEELRVSPQTVRNWALTGLLPALRFGAPNMRRFRIRREDLEAFIHEQEVPPK